MRLECTGRAKGRGVDVRDIGGNSDRAGSKEQQPGKQR